MSYEIKPPLKEWFRPKYRRYLSQKYAGYVALRITKYERGTTRDSYDVITAIVPRDERTVFHKYNLIPRDYLDRVVSDFGPNAKNLVIRSLPEE